MTQDTRTSATGSAGKQAAEFSENMKKVAEQCQHLVNDFLQQQAKEGGKAGSDPFNIGSAFMELTTKMMSDPAKLVEAQTALWQDYMNLGRRRGTAD